MLLCKAFSVSSLQYFDTFCLSYCLTELCKGCIGMNYKVKQISRKSWQYQRFMNYTWLDEMPKNTLDLPAPLCYYGNPLPVSLSKCPLITFSGLRCTLHCYTTLIRTLTITMLFGLVAFWWIYSNFNVVYGTEDLQTSSWLAWWGLRIIHLKPSYGVVTCEIKRVSPKWQSFLNVHKCKYAHDKDHLLIPYYKLANLCKEY